MNDWYDAEQRVERAKEFFDQHKWPEALEELRAAVSLNPYNGGWYFNIGLTLDEMQRFDEAIDAYRQALDIEADDLDALSHLGTDLGLVGRHRDALEVFNRAEKIAARLEPAASPRLQAPRQP